MINLDADPSLLISRDFITDEGWWAHNARNAVFHGQWRTDEHKLLFVTGIVLVGTIFSVFFLIPHFGDWLQLNVSNGSGFEWSTRVSALGYSIPKLLRSPFYAEVPILTALSLLAAGVWIAGISKDGLKSTIRNAGDLEVTSATLLIGYLLTLSITIYQPERRFIPVLLLMVILSASVLEKGWETLEGFCPQRPAHERGRMVHRVVLSSCCAHSAVDESHLKRASAVGSGRQNLEI